MIAGAFIILKGFVASRFPKLRRIIFNETGFSARFSRFHQRRMNWDQVSSVRLGKTWVEITSSQGQTRKLKLRKFENRKEIQDQFSQWASRQGIKVEAESILPQT
jgi:hypothetical protein